MFEIGENQPIITTSTEKKKTVLFNISIDVHKMAAIAARPLRLPETPVVEYTEIKDHWVYFITLSYNNLKSFLLPTSQRSCRFLFPSCDLFLFLFKYSQQKTKQALPSQFFELAFSAKALMYIFLSVVSPWFIFLLTPFSYKTLLGDSPKFGMFTVDTGIYLMSNRYRDFFLLHFNRR